MKFRESSVRLWCVTSLVAALASGAGAQSSRSGAPAVLSNNPPVAICQSMTVNADAGCVADASIDNGSYDPDGDPVTITQNPAGPYPLGVTNVTLTILDDGGLSDQCQATITVEDNTPPEVFCPVDIIRLACGAPTGPDNTGWATLIDNCDPSPVLTYEDTEVPNTLGVPLIMTIFREWIGTDMYGNILDCVQPILIYDETPPVFTYCPPDVAVNCGDPTHPDQTGWAEGEDNCNQAPVLTFADVTTAGACPQEFSITRTWYLNDQTGAEDVTCVQIISVVDETPPEMSCPDGVSVECLTEVPAPNPGLVTATDNCDPEPIIEFVSDNQQGVCPIIVTRTYSATDACGNVATCEQIFTVQDLTDPVITGGPGPAEFECTTEIPLPTPELIIATDNCDNDLLVEFVEDVSDGQTCPEIITRTYRVSDDCDNFVLFEQQFTIEDITSPSCTAPADQTIFLCESEEQICLDIVVVDNCDTDLQIELVQGPGEIVDGQWCYTPPSLTGVDVLIRVTDDCGNSCEYAFHLDIDGDDTPPNIVCPDPVTVECLNEVPDPDIGLVVATDNCQSDPVVQFVSDNLEGICPIIVTRTYSATDARGNVATCDQIFTVLDITDPVITGGPVNAAFECTTEIPLPTPELVIATDNCDLDLLVEFVDDVSDGQTCPEIITRTYRVSDDCDNFALYEQQFTIEDITSPSCTVPEDQTIFLCEPEQICLDIMTSDNCDADPQIELVSGLGAIIDGQWCYTPPSITGADVLIRVTDNCGNTCEDQFHLDIIVNTAPELTACPEGPISLAWGDTYSFDFDATDADTEQSLTFDLTADAPNGATVNSQTGLLQWITTANDICTPDFGVIVRDECGAADTCLLEVCISNVPPALSCPDDVTICHGFPYESQVAAADADQGPFAFFYLLDSPPGLTLDVSTGALEWDDPTPGTWEVCVIATDSAAICDPCSPSNADTCCFVIEVATLDIVIEKIHDQIQGQYTEVGIDFIETVTNRAIAGFDFLIQYDASALSFQKATEGEFLSECEWEYFTYRFGSDGNCGNSACPTGVLRVLALAETSGGNPSHHPSCFTNNGVAMPGPGSSLATELVSLTFFVSDDRTLECQYAPIRFVWYDCGDNSMSDAQGDRLFVSNRVFDYAGESVDPPMVYWTEVTGIDNSFPTLTGVPGFLCLAGRKVIPEKCANFYNGGVDIICADSIDAVGDVNLNGIGYEIADAVMFTNYFIEGMLAFGGHVDGSVAASDTNRDGLALSVADLVYLIRVIIGDADPYAKTAGVTESVANYELNQGVLSISTNELVGGIALKVEGDVRPELLVSGFDLRYAYDGTQTRLVVVPSLNGTSAQGLNGECLGGIDGRIVEIEAAAMNGAPLQIESLPVGFRLQQNYPNPFNPTTTIGFNLLGPGRYRLEIFNIQGQLVRQIDRQTDRAGYHTLDWDGSDFASGIYLYRLEADGQSSTRKMLLLK